MSAHVLLNLLQDIKCEDCQVFYLFFATSLIDKIIQEHENVRFYLSYEITITLKSHFGMKTSRVIFIVFMNATLLNGFPKQTNHQWFINFNTWRFITILVQTLFKKLVFEKRSADDRKA